MSFCNTKSTTWAILFLAKELSLSCQDSESGHLAKPTWILKDLHAAIYRYRGVPGCLLPKLRGHYHAAKIPGRSACSIISLSRCSWMPLTKAKRALSCRQDPRKICMQHYIAIEVFLDASYQS